MKKIICVFFAMLMLVSCARKDGVVETSTGWDLTKDGKTYRYRCEADAFYLYIDWNGDKSYKIEQIHQMDNKSFTDVNEVTMKFLCVNKDRDNVYIAEYSEFNKWKPTLGFICDTDGGNGLYFLKNMIPDSFKLFEKYINR